ncbi:hypothetical protein HDU67_001582 [Dinochytrium kinnereticum]|nr:hypothetical protein HDU67_001582 [Dinochytrium kinnereticum]
MLNAEEAASAEYTITLEFCFNEESRWRNSTFTKLERVPSFKIVEKIDIGASSFDIIERDVFGPKRKRTASSNMMDNIDACNITIDQKRSLSETFDTLPDMRTETLSLDQFLSLEELAINHFAQRNLSQYLDIWKRRSVQSKFESERKMVFAKAWEEHRLKRKILYAWIMYNSKFGDTPSNHDDIGCSTFFNSFKSLDINQRRVSFPQDLFDF